MAMKTGPKPVSKRSSGGGQSHDRDIRWVMSHLSVEGDETPPTKASAPSASAWRLYCIYNADAETRLEFSKTLYQRAVTKEKPTEIATAKIDDQRKQFQMIRMLEAERPDFIEKARNGRQTRSAAIEGSIAIPGGSANAGLVDQVAVSKVEAQA